MLALVTVSLLSACDAGSIVKMSHKTDVEHLLTYLSAGELEKAEAMIHKEYTESVQLEQISEFLAGRKVEQMQAQNVNISNQLTSGGAIKQESATFKLTLDDGEVAHLSVIFLESTVDKGFSSVQLVLG